jgi:rhomboid family GlyGly-CTERM serine protease
MNAAKPGFAWVLACVALGLTALAAMALPPWVVLRFDWQPMLADSQPWRWWSAAVLHWNPLHLVINLVGLVLVALFGHAVRVPPLAVLAWLAAWPLTHLVLFLQPQLLHYVGLSGLLHAGVTVVAVWGLFTLSRRGRFVAELVVVGLVAKLLFEQPWEALAGGSTSNEASGGWGFQVAPLAHAGGTAAGLVCALLALAQRSPVRSGEPAADA